MKKIILTILFALFTLCISAETPYYKYYNINPGYCWLVVTEPKVEIGIPSSDEEYHLRINLGKLSESLDNTHYLLAELDVDNFKEGKTIYYEINGTQYKFIEVYDRYRQRAFLFTTPKYYYELSEPDLVRVSKSILKSQKKLSK